MKNMNKLKESTSEGDPLQAMSRTPNLESTAVKRGATGQGEEVWA